MPFPNLELCPTCKTHVEWSERTWDPSAGLRALGAHVRSGRCFCGRRVLRELLFVYLDPPYGDAGGSCADDQA